MQKKQQAGAPARMGPPSLSGKRVLVVEDEAIIAIQIEDDLLMAGCVVVGPAASVKQALYLIEYDFVEIAVLDYRLREETSREIAVRLDARQIPFMFLSGNALADLPRELRKAVLLQKPVSYEALIEALNAIVEKTAERRMH